MTARSSRFGRASRLLAGCAALALATGCSSWFGPDRPKPKPLAAIASPMAVQSTWKLSIGKVDFAQAMAVNGDVVTVAAGDGTVVAVDAQNGRPLWRASVGARLSAGVGSDGKSAAVVTRDGDLVVLEAGAVKWRKPLGVRVASAPLVAGERVFVLAVDRSVQAFDGQTGQKLWQFQRPGDPLALSQSGVLVAFKNTLVVGQGPRLAGLDPVAATLRWEVAIGSPRGANEIERLADLVGPPVRAGDVLCARSFQAGVGCVDAEAGAVRWTKTVGGTEAIGGDADMLFGSDGSDRLSAWRTPSGDVAWTSEALMFRSLSAPAAIGSSVVFGDGDGMLHWLSRDKGEARARTPTDGSAIVVAPVVVGGQLIVLTRSGSLFAFRPG
ncbi:MAG: outer membrane protein assembly factor BamB [Caldimonas sp.]